MLCLCPNDHVLFDKGAIYIESDYVVRKTTGQAVVGALRLRSGHVITDDYIAYHREHFAGERQ